MGQVGHDSGVLLSIAASARSAALNGKLTARCRKWLTQKGSAPARGVGRAPRCPFSRRSVLQLYEGRHPTISSYWGRIFGTGFKTADPHEFGGKAPHVADVETGESARPSRIDPEPVAKESTLDSHARLPP